MPGNQILSEARFYQKPVFTIPEPGQYEQHVNALFVERMGMGVACQVDNLTRKKMCDFAENIGKTTAQPAPNGASSAVSIIENYL